MLMIRVTVGPSDIQGLGSLPRNVSRRGPTSGDSRRASTWKSTWRRSTPSQHRRANGCGTSGTWIDGSDALSSVVITRVSSTTRLVPISSINRTRPARMASTARPGTSRSGRSSRSTTACSGVPRLRRRNRGRREAGPVYAVGPRNAPMEPMDLTPVRCPHCRKKQDEPCPKRCGCGQSLLAELAARSGETEASLAGGLKLARLAAQRPQVLAANVSPGDPQSLVGGPRASDNEW